MTRGCAVLALLLALSFFGRAHASNVLILIPSEQTKEFAQLYTDWILWPPADASGNRFLSLLTGMDWQGRPDDFSFRPGPSPGEKLSDSFGSLKQRGYFLARNKLLSSLQTAVIGPPPRPAGLNPGPAQPSLDSIAALLGLSGDSPAVEIVPYDRPWPENKLLIFAAQSPNEIGDVVRRAGGRALIVAIPSEDSMVATRALQEGVGWPSGEPTIANVAIPGLIPARDAIRLLIAPASARWTGANASDPDTPNSWIQLVQVTGQIFLVFVAIVVLYLVACAIYYIIKQEPGRFAALLLRLVMLGPAIIILGGRLTHAVGTANWMPALLGAGVIVCTANLLLAIFLRVFVASAHPLLGECIAGLAVACAFDPAWSFFSQSLSAAPFPASPEAAGAMLMYLTGAIAFTKKGPMALAILARGAAAGLLAWAFLGAPPWVGNEPSYRILPIVALLAGDLLIRWPLLIVLALLSDQSFRLLRHGVTWAPGGLYPTYAASASLNLYQHVLFLMSPSFLGLASGVGFGVLFGERFLVHQLRRALAFDTRPKALIAAAIAAAAMGLLQPSMLYIALTTAIGAATVLLFDALRAP